MRKWPVTLGPPRISLFVFMLQLLSLFPFSSSGLPSANAVPPPVTTTISPTDGTGSPASLGTIITSGTSVVPTALCTASCVITGGTTAGHNLFHSFGDFNIGASDSARFQTGLVNPLPDASVSNILGRITGGNISNIFGALDSATYYPSANLFLMNPAGFLFGPHATVNVGGMIAFTTADYLRLQGIGGNGTFYADPAQASVLTNAPVAAFGFLGSNPGAITVQGGQLSVSPSQSISLVGGNITVQAGTLDDGTTVQPAQLSALGGQINLVSVASPGEVLVANFEPAPAMALGSINLSQGTLIDVSGNAGGTIRIRSGSLVMDNATISADSIDADGASVAIEIKTTENVSISAVDLPALTARTTGAGNAGKIGIYSGSMDVTATVINSFYSVIDTHTAARGNAGSVDIKTGDLTVSSGFANFIDSGTSGPNPGRGGDVAITAHDIRTEDSTITTGNLTASFFDEGGAGTAGNVTITAESLQMTSSQINTDSQDFVSPVGTAGNITINAHNINLEGTSFSSSGQEHGGVITITADQLFANGTIIATQTVDAAGGPISVIGRSIELTNGSSFVSTTDGDGHAGSISIVATDHLSLLPSTSFGRPSGIFSSSFGGVGTAGNAGDIFITTPRLEMTGGARIDTSTATSGRGGNVTIHTSDSLSISGETDGQPSEPLFSLGSLQPSGIFTRTVGGHCSGLCGDAGNISISTGSLITGSGAQINSGTSSSGQGGAISVSAGNVISISGTLSTGQPGGIQSRTIGTNADAGSGGNIALIAGQSVTISNGAAVSASTLGSGDAGTVTIEGTNSPAQSVLIDGSGSGIFTTTEGTGTGGNISIDASQFALSNQAMLSAQTAGSGDAGNITVMASSFSMTEGTRISAGTGEGTTGHGGNISVQADEVLLTDNAGIVTNTLGSGDAGAIAITAQDRISLTNSRMNSSTFAFLGKPEGGQGGQITLHAPTIDMSNSEIVSLSSSSGNAGNVLLETAHLTLDASTLSAAVIGSGAFSRSGNGGDITIRGLTGAGSAAEQVALMGASQVLSDTSSTGNGGTIAIQTAQLMMQDNIFISTSSQGEGTTGNAGNVTLNASQSLRVTSGSLIQSGSFVLSEGNAGNIKVTAPAITLDAGTISTTTESAGSAGTVMIKTNSFTVQNGGQITSSSVIVDDIPSGSAGNITIQGLDSPAQSVLIDGSGSGIFTDTQGTGAGGNIFVNANSVTLQNGGKLSASTSGTALSAIGGTITVDATNTVTMHSASITASSTGVADAGSINITSPNGFTMRSSIITTQAGQGAGGGNIKVTTSPAATVLFKDSLINASVADGPGGGGNISIDPQFVILLNSQILAQAAQGQGGAITIIAGLFLQDANSKVNADSGSGVNGTVTIQSPNAPISGQIQPLGKTPLIATTLLNQHCASLAGGEFSSFIVAGRDSLPAEPGGWLSSQLVTLNTGTGLESMPLGASRAGTTPLLSLRQIAPPGFLTQAFAVDQTGCTS